MTTSVKQAVTGLDQRMRATRDFGARVRKLRTRAKKSQVWLAQQMQSRGFHWYQATVHRTETGDRATLLKEAEALALIFKVALSSFQWDEALGEKKAEKAHEAGN